MDDTFVLFKEEKQSDLFLNYLNDQHNNIKFTLEKENNNVLPFLNVNVKRTETKFELSIYRKPTFTKLGMNYLATRPRRLKSIL